MTKRTKNATYEMLALQNFIFLCLAQTHSFNHNIMLKMLNEKKKKKNYKDFRFLIGLDFMHKVLMIHRHHHRQQQQQ